MWTLILSGHRAFPSAWGPHPFPSNPRPQPRQPLIRAPGPSRPLSGVIYRWSHVVRKLSSVQSLSRVRLFATPWTAARQASLSITDSRSLLKLMSIGSVMPSSHLILCCPLLLPPSIFPSIRVFSNKSALCIRWPKHWSYNFQ